MKIRNRHLIRAAGWTGSRLARTLVGTVRTEHRCLGPVVAPAPDVPPGARYVFSAWHETLLLPAIRFGHPDVAVLVSKHADGQLLTALIESTGMGLVQGSTNRGGIEAVRRIIGGTDGRRHLIVTTDGPRGPRRTVQGGIVYIASRTGMAVVPTGVGYDRPWRASSWDRFAVPRPFSSARILLGEPIPVPADLRANAMEPYREAVQAEMDRLTAAAEAWAETGKLELPAATLQPAGAN